MRREQDELTVQILMIPLQHNLVTGSVPSTLE